MFNSYFKFRLKTICILVGFSALQWWKSVQKLPRPEKLIQITFSEGGFHANLQLLLQDSLAA